MLLLLPSLLLPHAAVTQDVNVTWVVTTNATAWQQRAAAPGHHLPALPADAADYGLIATDRTAQTIDGFGACFNELGWDALQSLPEAEREKQLKDFWSPTDGMGLVYNRVPVGGNDYADGWYSLDEMPPGMQDLEMKHFSVARDEKKLIPYILAARSRWAAATAGGTGTTSSPPPGLRRCG